MHPPCGKPGFVRERNAVPVKEPKEPKVRRDGKCVVCKGERPFNPQRGVSPDEYLKDPFCSTVCARKHYEVKTRLGPLSTSEEQEA